MKKKAGQPSKFKNINIEQMKLLIADGYTDKRLSKFFKMTEPTFNSYKKIYPKFFKSLKKSKEQADKKVVQSLFKRATGFEYTEVHTEFNSAGIMKNKTTIVKQVVPDTTACIFWLKNRQPGEWRDVQHIDAKGVSPHYHFTNIQVGNLETKSQEDLIDCFRKTISKDPEREFDIPVSDRQRV